jgi:acetyl esterase/lipase
VDPDIPSLRKMLFERKKAMTAAQSDASATAGIKEEDFTIPARDGFPIPIRTYKPESPPAGGSPLVVFIHGGGFVIGGLEGEELNCRLFVQKLGCVCVNVDYRLAPEYPFPTPVQDGWDAVKWAAANASKLGADPSKGFIVGGTSAGGNIAAVAGHLARDEKLSPPVTGLALLIPALADHTLKNIDEKYAKEIISYEQNKDAPVLPMKSVELFMSESINSPHTHIKANISQSGHYKPDPKSHLFNLFAPPINFSNLPPTMIQICGMDPLRDEAMIYERLLREEYNCKTKRYMYPGLPHGYWSFFPQGDVSKKFVQETVEGMEWLLQQK